MPLYVRCGFPYVGQQGVCAGYGVDPAAVVVEIVVDDRRVEPLMLSDVREQPGASEEVDEDPGVPELFEDGDEVAREHAFLPHERQWGGEVEFFHCRGLYNYTFNSNFTFSFPESSCRVFSRLFS